MSLVLLHRTPPADGGTGQNPQTSAGLMALAPPGRLNSVSPLLPYIGTGWKAGQTLEYSIFVNPLDATQLLMYYAGLQNPGVNGGIGLATAAVSDPTHWTDYASNPLYTGGNQVRSNTVLWNPDASKFWMYVSPDDNNINLYTSSLPTGPFVLDSNVFTPGQCLLAGCTSVSNMAVLRVDATHWYGYFSHRGSYGVLPSIRLATSPDGKVWTDTGQTMWAKSPGTYYATYLEGMNQIIPMPDGTYILVTSAYDSTNWVCAWASSPSLIGPFTPAAAPMFVKNPTGGTFDCGMVANPSVFNLNGRWYLFYAGSIQPGAGGYSNSYWSTGIALF
jgi:hypothetical protein